MRRTSLGLAAVSALALALAPGLADARAGGGGSFGSRGSMTWSSPPTTKTAPYAAVPMQRSMTPNSPSPGYGGFGAPGYAPRSGFMSGLMGGLIGAGLGGLLLGHGFFGGMMGFGGFLGLGEDYYPVPWGTLKYDTRLGGYRVNLTADKLKNAPKYSQSTGWNWNRENDRRVYDYYQASPYW